MKTSTQYRVLDFLKSYHQQHGYPPSLAEIAMGIGVRSRSLISRHIHSLAKAGYIELEPGKYRQIRLKPLSQPQVPILGRIAAGLPIAAITDSDAIDVIDLLVRDQRGTKLFGLIVQGDSMIEEGIFDGDIVLCEKRDTAEDGEIVIALIDHAEATLKRFYKAKNGMISLVPANIALKPQVYEAHRVQIQGIFRGLVRLSR